MFGTTLPSLSSMLEERFLLQAEDGQQQTDDYMEMRQPKKITKAASGRSPEVLLGL